MLRNIQVCLLVVMSLILSLLLGGCGSSNKEGATATAVPTVDEATCRVCHSTTLDPKTGQQLLPEYLASVHNAADRGCQGCHGGGAQHNGVGPIPFPNPLDSNRCNNAACHNNRAPSAAVTADFATKCAPCHSAAGNTDVHSARAIDSLPNPDSCVDCHDIAAPQHGSRVGDNDGVRAIIPEFGKRSHHILNAAGGPKNEQCAVCHLEGTIVDGQIVVNDAYHMKDDKVYLRNADTDAALPWSGTEHTNVDNFCFSCHDSDGATSAAIKLIMTGKNFGGAFAAKNPFADTLTNGYDQVTRTGVADVKTAFTATNASHHAVSGQRYKYRFSTAANAALWAARTGKPMPAASEIAEGHTDLDGNLITGFDETMTGDFTLPTAAIPGGGNAEKGEGEATLYEAGKFVATYTPLGATQNVADNSTLHCGDCHTVGQWKPGSSTSADGSATTVAIGAHGSANEYLLRNSLGTDELHNSLTYVCFNCHVAGVLPGTTDATKAGFGVLHPNQNKNQIVGYATSHAVSAMHIQCLADSADNIGAVDRLAKSWEGDKVKVYDYVPAPGATASLPVGGAGSDANSGNITGIACINCHNSGLRSSFSGIHGGDNTYVDGFNRTQKSYRFMPGMGNYRYAPPGGWDGKDESVKTPAGKPAGGCYTNGAADTNPGYSACSHHGTQAAPVGSPTAAGGSAPVLGGGTAKAPFTDPAAEYTVREATAGNALVTRPLKY